MTTSVTRAGAGEVSSPAPAGRPRGRRRWAEIAAGKNPIGLVFSAPYAIFLALVFVYPLALGVYIAFHDYVFTAPGAVVDRPFVGFDNFVDVLTDPKVIASFGHVAIFLVINVPLTIMIGLLLAAALNQGVRRFRTAFRVAYYIPYVTASVATVTVWMFMFNTNGIVNTLLGPLAPDPSWLVNPVLAMPMIAVYVTWKQLGFFILLYLAALQNIPDSLYEAAKTDGANAWQTFWAVTWPGVLPATGLVAMLAIITGANLFTEPYLLTGGGGPNGASTTPVLLIYQEGIQQNHPGTASAIGIVLVIGVLALTWVARRVTEGRDR
jgi:multiple sugar transport system permease protein